MGEAARRGTLEQRAAAAIVRDEYDSVERQRLDKWLEARRPRIAGHAVNRVPLTLALLGAGGMLGASAPYLPYHTGPRHVAVVGPRRRR